MSYILGEKDLVSCIPGVCDVSKSSFTELGCFLQTFMIIALHSVCSKVAFVLSQLLALSLTPCWLLLEAFVKSGAVPKTVSSGQLSLWAWMHADSAAWAQMTGRRRYKVGLWRQCLKHFFPSWKFWENRMFRFDPPCLQLFSREAQTVACVWLLQSIGRSSWSRGLFAYIFTAGSCLLPWWTVCFCQ